VRHAQKLVDRNGSHFIRGVGHYRDRAGIKMCLPKRRKACAEPAPYCRHAISRQKCLKCFPTWQSPWRYEYLLGGKIANSFRLVAGNRDGKTKRISRLPAFLAVLDQYERLPSGNLG
jgi:hypothetical protein